MRDWSLVQRVRFGDVDALQHLNNVQFLRFFETARIAWFGDQSRAANVADLLAGNPRPVTLFPSYGSGNCQDHPEAAGKSSCGPALWSPDGLWVYAPDVVGKTILIARSDGSGQVRKITLDHPMDLANGPGGLLAWQPIAP